MTQKDFQKASKDLMTPNWRNATLLSLLILNALLAGAQITCLDGDCLNTKGTGLFPSGAKYVGDFVNGQLHGEGILYFTNGDKYIGQWNAQHRQGKGRLVFANGNEYFGDFEQGHFHGEGEMLFADGKRYVGSWANDRMHGQGNLYLIDGSRYEGSFVNGAREGFGVLFWPSGDRYEGFWAQDGQHGNGMIILRSGRKISGQWLYGRFQAKWETPALYGDPTLLRDCAMVRCHGLGKRIYPDGTKYFGVFVNGKAQGQARVEYPNGDVYEGEWSNSAPNGLGRMLYLTGNTIAAYWEQGRARVTLSKEQRIAPENSPTDNTTRVWAVLVGAARYYHMPALQYTDDDAYKLYAFLKSPQGGALPDQQLRILVDEDATRANVLGAIEQLFYRADENDIVLFYFSGHGLPGAFLPTDYDGANNAIDHHAINRLLVDCRAKNKIVLADACHAGSLSGRKSPDNTPYYKVFQNTSPGTALLMSSKSEEYSLEDGGLRSGIFSHFLVRGLKGAADVNENKVVTLQELFQYVHAEVRRYTGNLQTPVLTGNLLPGTPLATVSPTP